MRWAVSLDFVRTSFSAVLKTSDNAGLVNLQSRNPLEGKKRNEQLTQHSTQRMPATVSQETELPSLKPEALWSLTKKIEVNLKKAPVERASKTPQLKPPKARKTKDSNSRPTELSEAKVKTTAKSRNGGVTQSAPKLPLPVPQRPEGKKRFRDGQIKGPDNSRSEVNKIKVTGRESSKASRHNLNIEEEILALGGTKDDYQLIADALSDSEIEGNDMDIHSVPLDDMQRELLRLVKELGVEKAHAQEQGDPQGEEQDDSFEDGDRDSNPLNVPPRINGNGEKSTLQLTGATGKGSSYIVCPFHMLHQVH